MAERTIRHASFAYRVEVPDPIRPGQTIFHEKRAWQGETVDIPFEDDIERGERFGAFVTDALPAPGETPTTGEIGGDGDEDEASTADMTDEELVTWIKEDKPNVQTVIDAAEGDPDQARRLLEAEDKATGGDSRKGVVDGLTAIVSNA